jgi:di/tricarboxylate transporter
MSGGLTLLLVSGILTPQEALSGLANEGMVTVAVLYIVVSGVRNTGGLEWVIQRLLGQPRSETGAQARLMTQAAGLSAFLNNTPVVALLVPAVQDWAKRNRFSVSRLMIPLSYASIAGGTCTLIGTSTNLVLNGLLVSETGLPPLGLFELAWVGIPLVLLVVGYVLLTSRWLLPERVPVVTRYDDAREYTVEMLVEPGSPVDGISIREAGLRQLPGLYLTGIERDGRQLACVAPEEEIKGNDRLQFAGVVESVVDLQKIRGLKPATPQVDKLAAPRHARSLTEAVLSDSSPLVGRSICEGRFRNRYNAVVIAVARNGRRLSEKIGDIIMRPGDTLLLETGAGFFLGQQASSRDFYLVSRLPDSSPPRHERAGLALSILALMVLMATAGWLSMLEAAMLAAGMMIFTRCTTGRMARQSVDWQVLIVIAASFGIGTALQKTGAAGSVAETMIHLSQGEPWSALLMVFLVTALLSSIITNNVAAVLMFPIVVALSETIGVSLLPFVITIMIAASASFATPIGYQTNLMVYGVGGYRFADFLRIGIPLTLFAGVLTLILVPLIWPF